MKSQVIQITPDKAREMLAGNTMNRPKSISYIRSLAKEMVEGRWAMTAEPIIVSDEGILLDGQHRLEAVVLSEKTVDFLVARGVDKNVFKFIDTGKNRSAADVLAIEGFTNSSFLATIAKSIIAYENGYVSKTNAQGIGVRDKSTIGVTNADLLAYVKDHEKLVRDCYRVGDVCRKSGNFLTLTNYALLHYIFGNIDSKESEAFLLKIAKGANLSEGSAILKLRGKLINAQMSRRPYLQKVVLGMCFKAWNLYRKGRDKGQIDFYEDSDLPELI